MQIAADGDDQGPDAKKMRLGISGEVITELTDCNAALSQQRKKRQVIHVASDLLVPWLKSRIHERIICELCILLFIPFNGSGVCILYVLLDFGRGPFFLIFFPLGSLDPSNVGFS